MSAILAFIQEQTQSVVLATSLALLATVRLLFLAWPAKQTLSLTLRQIDAIVCKDFQWIRAAIVSARPAM